MLIWGCPGQGQSYALLCWGHSCYLPAPTSGAVAESPQSWGVMKGYRAQVY